MDSDGLCLMFSVCVHEFVDWVSWSILINLRQCG